MKVKILSVLAGSVMLAGTANAAYTGLYSEEYTNATYTQPAGTITYRLYATFDNPDDQLTGLGGKVEEPWELTTNTIFFQEDTYGDDWAHNQALDLPFDALGLHFDSYWTIGTDDSTAGAPLGQAWPGALPTWTDTKWFANDGGIYRVPEDPLTFPVNGMVLIGQFTIDISADPGDEYLYGYVKVAGMADGEALNVYEDILIPIPAPGALALLGLAGLVGRRRR